MRTIIITAVIVCLAAIATAGALTGGSADCYDNVAKNAHIGDTITVFTKDTIIILGRLPIFKVSPSMLYIRLVTDTGIDYITIPTEEIDRIAYRKPSWARWGVTIAGLGIGAVAGTMAGVSAAPESGRWLTFSEIQYGVLGGVIGGVIGIICGNSIGKHFTTTVTIQCQP